MSNPPAYDYYNPSTWIVNAQDYPDSTTGTTLVTSELEANRTNDAFARLQRGIDRANGNDYQYVAECVCNASYPYPSTGGIIGNSKAQKASNPFRVKYMPLLSRSTAEAYEQRAAQVGGSRKERLQRHLDMQETNARDGQQFFAHFRAQGSL